MRSKSGLGDLLDIKHSPRLSIAEIDRRWKNELHQRAGHQRYQAKHLKKAQSATNMPAAEHSNALLDTVQEIFKIGSWVTQDGQPAPNEDNIQDHLIRLVQRGVLPLYKAQSPQSAPYTPQEVSEIKLSRNPERYFIDRDNLGCLLVHNDIALPRFWYDKADAGIYRDRLARQEADRLNLKEQCGELLKENEVLKKRLRESWPFLDPKHPFFSAELEAAVSCWMAHYADKGKGEKVANKPKLKLWISENKAEVVTQADGTLSKSALDRIIMVVNPNKQGGRTPAKG